MTSAAHANKPARRWGRWVVLALALAVVAFVGLFAWDALQLKSSSEALRVHAAGAQQAITNRDAAQLTSEVQLAQEAAADFAGATDGPHWWIANHLPWVKKQTQPLTTAGQATLAVVDGALGPLADLEDLDALQAPKIENGHIDPFILEPYRETLADAAQVMQEQQQQLDQVSLEGTVELVREPFLELKADLATIGGTVQGAHVASEVLPSMLGAEGKRTYLVMVQNNAEPRTTGGIPGAVIEVFVEDGTITMGRYVTAGSMVDMDGIDVPLTEDEDAIFTGRMIKFPQDVNFTPEYPRSAEFMQGFWLNEFGETVDGVLSVDPVALGYMLDGMEPVEVGTLTITGPTLSQVMLNDSYFAYPEPKDQDAFFTEASGVLFGILTQGGTSAVEGTERAIEEHRFLVWSTHEQEQELLRTTTIAGDFIEHTETLGLFVNDGSGSKIGYYIDTQAEVTNHLCTDGSLRGQTIDLTLTHTFDGDVADLPWYISGGGNYVPEGEFHANLLIYPLPGEDVTKVSVDGEPGGLAPNTHDGRRMAKTWIELVPGQTMTVSYELRATEHGLLPPNFQFTPGPKPQVNVTAVDEILTTC